MSNAALQKRVFRDFPLLPEGPAPAGIHLSTELFSSIIASRTTLPASSSPQPLGIASASPGPRRSGRHQMNRQRRHIPHRHPQAMLSSDLCSPPCQIVIKRRQLDSWKIFNHVESDRAEATKTLASMVILTFASPGGLLQHSYLLSRRG